MHYIHIHQGATISCVMEYDFALNIKITVFMRKSSCCFQRILAITILSVRHTGGSVKNGAS